MTGLYDFFQDNAAPAAAKSYRRVGYPRNPFLPSDGAGVGEPFYAEHIKEPLRRLTDWVRGVHAEERYLAASLIGNIGAGKTRILELLSGGIRKWPSSERAFVHSVHLSQSGYARASAGALLLGAFESGMDGVLTPTMPRCPGTGILPVVWAIVHSDVFPSKVDGQVAQALRRARDVKDSRERELLCEDISLWLRRQSLTPARVRASGLTRTIDWEGELIPILSDLLRFARACGLLKSLFLFIDQIEDLFTPSFTQVRRSRLLTDLRALVDQADDGAPVGLLLAWAPESDDTLTKKYEALSNRLRRIRIELPLLTRDHAPGFAKVWVDAMESEPGFDLQKQPRIDELAGDAWSRLRKQGVLLQPDRATPRELLRALAEEVDLRAGVNSE
jgi:hypothetical protein